MSIRTNCYVYGLITPIAIEVQTTKGLLSYKAGQTFYIGKGSGERVENQKKGSRSWPYYPSQQVVNAIKKRGYEVEHVIYKDGLDCYSALIFESKLIGQGKRSRNLANVLENERTVQSHQLVEIKDENGPIAFVLKECVL